MINVYQDKYSIHFFKPLSNNKSIYYYLTNDIEDMQSVHIGSSGILLDQRINNIMIRYMILKGVEIHPVFSEFSVSVLFESIAILRKLEWTLRDKKVYKIKLDDEPNKRTIEIKDGNAVTIYKGFDIMRFNLNDERR